MAEWTTRWRWHTEYNADSAEWCPVEPYRRLLVCGTYQLDVPEETKKQKRRGRIYLFSIDENTTSLEPIQTIETTGILDQKWCYHKIQGYPILAAVTSEGLLQLYRLVDEDGALSLKLWIEDTIGQDVLALSLDWSTNKTVSEEPRIVVSDSVGCITVFKIVGEILQKIGKWTTHEFEAWISAFNYWNSDVFYSGGDDCVFRSYDVRAPDVAVTTNRSHEAGVTAIRSHLHVEHQLLTGSKCKMVLRNALQELSYDETENLLLVVNYDEKVRLWDTRNLKRCISETNVNGGVWRLKYHPLKPSSILAACMYGGFRLLKQDEKIDIVFEYLEHESIAYGADWQYGDKKDLVATCSFYDCKLHVSEVFIE